MAIRNGFDRATTTIIDANVTTLISAIVLYIMGTDQVKGFAVTLILGIVMNLYTAIFVSRVFFDIAEKMRFITDLKMLHILSNPNFDFIGKRRIAIAISLIDHRRRHGRRRRTRQGAAWISTSPAASRCRRCSTSRSTSPKSATTIDNVREDAARRHRARRAHRERRRPASAS